MSSKAKGFDAVALMRAERERLSAAIESMTLDEELAWLASQDLQDPLLNHLRDRAARRSPRAKAQPPTARDGDDSPPPGET